MIEWVDGRLREGSSGPPPFARSAGCPFLPQTTRQIHAIMSPLQDLYFLSLHLNLTLTPPKILEEINQASLFAYNFNASTLLRLKKTPYRSFILVFERKGVAELAGNAGAL
jgi:hypothetical protein